MANLCLLGRLAAALPLRGLAVNKSPRLLDYHLDEEEEIIMHSGFIGRRVMHGGCSLRTSKFPVAPESAIISTATSASNSPARAVPRALAYFPYPLVQRSNDWGKSLCRYTDH